MSSPAPIVQSCPLKDRFALEVVVVGEDGAGLAGIALALLDGEKSIQSRTDSTGALRFEQLKRGDYQLSLSEIDQDAWELIDSVPLDPADAKSEGDAPWGGKPAAPKSEAIQHTIKEGECTAKVADRYGFFPDTVWNLDENAGLQSLRKDMNILYPGDVLTIPAKRISQISVSTENRYRIRRKGIPATLRIRFLIQDQPRTRIPYLMSTQTSDGKPQEDRQGETDSGGWVIEPLPPSAIKVTLTLGTPPELEEYEFEIGKVDPIDKIAGVRSRLGNLGYDCGGETGEELGEKTAAALAAFQLAQGLEATGKMDDATRSALQDQFQS